MKLFVIMMLAAGSMAVAETRLGKPLALKEATGIDQLLDAPESYAGKAVQVKGTVKDVCRMMGCWTELASSTGKSIRIKVKDGEIVFPKDSVGKTIVAEGTFEKQVLTKEQVIAQAKHEAEANNRKFDPASVKSGKTIYQIAGTGAVVLD